MPQKFIKEIIRPGHWFVQTDEGGIGVFQVDEKRVHHFYNQAKEMIRAGLSIPFPAEHGGERPQDKRERAALLTKNNMGFVTDAVLDGNTLLFEIEVADEFAGAIGKTIKGISPEIIPEFLDGSGKIWNDSIVHVAGTNKAVIVPQGDFQRVEKIAASADTLKSAKLLPKSLGARLFDSVGLETDESKSVALESASLALPFEKKKDEPDETDEDVEADRKTDETASDQLNADIKELDDSTTKLDESMDRPVKPEVIAALSRLNLFIPEKCTVGALEECLLVAANSLALKEQDETEETPEANSTEPVREETQVALSMTDQTPKPSPEAVQLSRLQTRMINGEKQSLLGRVNAMLESGRINPTQRDRMVQSLQTVSLSIDNDGEIQDSSGVSLAVSILEQTPEGTHFTPEDRAKLSVEQSPGEFFDGPGELSDERRKAVVDEQLGKTGHKPVYAGT